MQWVVVTLLWRDALYRTYLIKSSRLEGLYWASLTGLPWRYVRRRFVLAARCALTSKWPAGLVCNDPLGTSCKYEQLMGAESRVDALCDAAQVWDIVQLRCNSTANRIGSVSHRFPSDV